MQKEHYLEHNVLPLSLVAVAILISFVLLTS